MALQTLIANAVTSVNDLLAAQTPPVTIEEGETLVVETLDKRALYAVEFTASETAPVFSSDDNSWLRAVNEKSFVMPKGLSNAWILCNSDADIQLSVLPAAGGGLASDQTVKVVSSNPAAVAAGQKAIAVTGTAVSVGTGTFVNGVVIKSASTNSSNLFIGSNGVATTFNGSGSGYVLEPGEAIAYAVADLSSVYINGTAGDFITFTGN